MAGNELIVACNKDHPLLGTFPEHVEKFRSGSMKRFVDIRWMEIREIGTDLYSKIEAVGFIGAVAQASANHRTDVGYEFKSMPLLIHCTQKLLAEIPNRFIAPSASGAGWHANLLRFERRKCVLFTHDGSLYSVFVPGLRKPEFEQLDEVFGQRLFKALVWDQFSQTQIERMLEACRVVRFTRSSNRSVLGSMNDMRFQIGAYVEHGGGLTSVDLAQLHHELNRIPFSAIGYGYPVERLQEYLARAPDSSAAGDEGGGQSGSDSRVRDRS